MADRPSSYYKCPVSAVSWLITGKETSSSGFQRLVKEGKSEWTVEFLVRDPKWKPLFPDWVIVKAKARLMAASKKSV
jgi:hypothetical protein